MDTNQTRRNFLRLGLGAGGAVMLLPYGGRALAGEPAKKAGAVRVPTADQKLARFGRMFPGLAPFRPDASEAVTVANLGVLADAMLEPGGGVDTTQGAIFTYLGQFMDHDITLDLQPQPSASFSFSGSGARASLLDPSGAVVYDYESKKFNLSSLYGGGPDVSPQLYASDGIHFLVPENINGVLDLPRNDDGSAIVVEPRNDENQITSQLMVAFLLFHNAVVDRLGLKFKAAQKLVIQYYQWIILHQFMPTLFGQATIDAALAGKHRVYDPGADMTRPIMPVEFSAAAYRFGHSMIRNAYSLNPTLSPNNKPSRNTLFNGIGGANGVSGDGLASDLHGGYPLPASHVIDWGNFVNALYNPAKPGQSLQVFKQIGGGDGLHMIGQSMFGQPPGTPLAGTGAGLPIGAQRGAAQGSGSNSVAYRDLIRGYFYLLPSGQDVAAAYGITPLDPATVIDPAVAPGFTSGTPLWFYVLYETYLQNKNSDTVNSFDNTGTANDFNQVALGPVGARICTDVMLKLLELDGNGVPGNFTPQPPIAPAAGQFGIEDLLVFAGQAARP
jgi:heme peroxidase